MAREPSITQGEQLRSIGPFPAPPWIWVIHDTDGYNLYGCELALKNRGCSVHFGIERGPSVGHRQPEIRQWVPVTERAVHAEGLGATWGGTTRINSCSLGVELVNYGVGTGEYEDLPKPVWDPAKAGITNKEYGPTYDFAQIGRWESTATTLSYMSLCDSWSDGSLRQAAYPQFQLERLARLTAWIVSTNPKIVPENIVGHEHLTASKPDPGPAFPWDLFWQLTEDCLGDVEKTCWFDNEREKSLRVKGLQSHLARLGAYSMGIDGIWGNGTESGLNKVWAAWGDKKAWPKQVWDHAQASKTTLPLTKLLCTIGGKYR